MCTFVADVARRWTMGSSHMYQAMLKLGADVNKPDEDRNTHLINTAGGGHIKCVNVLLQAGADVNKERTGSLH